MNRSVRILPLHCGDICVSPTVPMAAGKSLKNSARQLLERAEQRLTLPVLSFLIEHPAGLFLMDAGWCRDISPRGVYDPAAVRAVLPPHLAAFYRPVLGPGQAIDEQLEALGLRATDLDAVLISHLDPDHVSGLKHLRGAKRIIVSEDEYFWSCRTVYKTRQPWKLWMDEPIERVFYRGYMQVPNNWAIDVLGDDSLVMINLPGHTDGQAGLRIRNGKNFALLTADAAFCPENWQQLAVPGFGFDEKLQLKCLKWIKEQSGMPSCAAVLASHDPAAKDSIVEF